VLRIRDPGSVILTNEHTADPMTERLWCAHAVIRIGSTDSHDLTRAGQARPLRAVHLLRMHHVIIIPVHPIRRLQALGGSSDCEHCCAAITRECTGCAGEPEISRPVTLLLQQLDRGHKHLWSDVLMLCAVTLGRTSAARATDWALA
jgi:hypothetical protein